MTFWDVLLGATSIISTLIITYIPLKFDIHKRRVHNTFLVFAVIAVCSGIWSLYNLWRESVNSDNRAETQQKNFSKQLTDELNETRKTIIDSMSSIYNSQQEKTKRQMDLLEERRQRKLTDNDKQRILKRINQVIKEHRLPSNIPVAVHYPLGSEEARQYAREIYFFLKSKGYNLYYPNGSLGDKLVASTTADESEKFFIVHHKPLGEEYININVGVIGSRP